MSTIPNIYMIPGLGGDKRMYAGQLAKFPKTQVLEFIPPLPKESISSYAKRLAQSIDFSEAFILIGVSLGGILAQEIAQYYPPKKIILISSVKSREELPFWMRIFKYLPIARFIPGKLYLWAFFILVWFKTLFTRSNAVMANLKNMARDANPEFVYWAVNQVVKWQNPIDNFKAYHIHGSNDFLFPIRRIKNLGTVIEGGTHVMILTHVAKINQALQDAINEA